ncbi:hypothetical protein ACQ4PT_026538 [Festuca glaucescens]
MSEKAEVHHRGLRAGGRKRTEKAKPDDSTEFHFRGVSQQPSGRYGAQIRESKGKAHTHRWLGTFDNAEDATRALDAAAVEQRGAAAITNFQQPVAVDNCVSPLQAAPTGQSVHRQPSGEYTAQIGH